MDFEDRLELNCLIRGDEAAHVFSIDISRQSRVAELKAVIKREKTDLCSVKSNDLILYKVTLPSDDGFYEALEAVPLPKCLSGLQRLSGCFPDTPQEDYIHILVENPNRNLRLNCLLLGDDPSNSTFTVDVPCKATVDQLKEVISEKRRSTLQHIEPIHLDLFKETMPRSIDTEPLNPALSLSNVFLYLPPDVVHIIVKRRGGRVPVPDADKNDVASVLTEAFGRATMITSKSLTPSQAAKSREYAGIQCGTQRILDCRCAADNPANTVAPPIQLFNPAFAYFSSKAFDPRFDVPEDFIRKTRSLMTEFALIHDKEKHRQDRLRTFLEGLIEQRLPSLRNSDNTCPDFVVKRECGNRSVYLVVGEEKNEFGDGGSDPSAQAAFSFQRIFKQPENVEVRNRCCCPVFIVAHAGPWLTIMGGIITTDCIVQRLTDFLWVPCRNSHDDSQCYRLARILYAFKQSVERLYGWYETVVDLTPLNPSVPTIHPRFFPTPNVYRREDGALITFKYQEPLELNEAACVTYRAATLEDKPKSIVVKFVTTYGTDAHKAMASAGFAPQLLYYGRIDVSSDPDTPSLYGDLRMVVMEYVVGTSWVELRGRKVPAEWANDLREAVRTLHVLGYVFGDIRPPNVIVTEDSKPTVKLIDFDWVGEEGKVRYPLFMSKSIKWPTGVQALGLIKREDDVAMVNALISDA